MPSDGLHPSFQPNKALAPLTRNFAASDPPGKGHKQAPGIYQKPPKGSLPRKPYSSNIHGVPWKNHFGQEMIPPWQSGVRKNADAELAITAASWSSYTLIDFVNALTQGGHGASIRNIFQRGGAVWNFLSKIGRFAMSPWIHWIEGPFWWMTALVGLIGNVLMLKLTDKAIRDSTKKFFESFKVMRENNQKQADYCIAVFNSHAAWMVMIRDFWRNALKTAQGITGMRSPGSFMQASEKAKAYEDGLKGMWNQKLILWDWAETFKKFAALQKKQNDGTITKTEEKQLTYLMTVIERKFNQVGNIVSHFGSVSGGQNVFRKKALDASNDISGNFHFARDYQSEFIALMTAFAGSGRSEHHAALVFLNQIQNIAEMIGLTIADGEARAAFGRFVFLAGYGTADEVWEEAAELYSTIKANECVSAQLPSYHEMMDIWAARNRAEAEKNYLKYGQRYPSRKHSLSARGLMRISKIDPKCPA